MKESYSSPCFETKSILSMIYETEIFPKTVVLNSRQTAPVYNDFLIFLHKYIYLCCTPTLKLQTMQPKQYWSDLEMKTFTHVI